MGASGALMYTASWQRWAGACRWGDAESNRCLSRQDHLYDFVAPTGPWEPVGDAAQLAGWSLLFLAFAFDLLPWALTGRRPGVYSATLYVWLLVLPVLLVRFAVDARGWPLAAAV